MGPLVKKKIVYRDLIKAGGLSSFHIEIKESDLLILADKKLSKQAEEALIWYRKDIEQYIYKHPDFKVTFKPFPLEEKMPSIVRAMAEAAQAVGVGPMAAVAGAIAEFVGKKLLNYCRQIIVENGGDIFMKVKKKKKVGICSAGTFGHSQNLGEADAVVVLSSSASLADATATAVGNIVKDDESIQKGLEFLRELPSVRGGIIIRNRKMGAWGQVKITKGI